MAQHRGQFHRMLSEHDYNIVDVYRVKDIDNCFDQRIIAQ